MADSQNNINIQITNGVDEGIAPRLLAISEGADKAAGSVGSLKSQLASIQSSGLGGILTLITSVKSETASAAAAQDNLTSQVRVNTTTVAQNAVARREQAAATRAAAAEARAYLQAEAGVREAQISGFLEAAQQEETLQANWQKELLLADQRIEKELELARARELSSLKSDIISRSAANAATEAEAVEAAKEEAAAKEAAVAADAELSAASAYLAERSDIEAAAYIQLAEATSILKAAKGDLSQLQRDIAAGNVSEESTTTLLASALAQEAEATEQLAAAKANLLEVQTYVTESTTAEAVAQNAARAATQGSVSANVSAAAAMGLLEGRTLSMNRAAANFVTKIAGLGPLLQYAFPIIGAIALVSVLYQMGHALYDVIEKANNAAREIGKAFDSILNPLRRTNDELALTNDKLDAQIAKLEHKPTSNGAALALDEARVMADKLEESLERVANELDNILKKNQISMIGGLLTNQGTTKDTSKFLVEQFDKIQKVKDEAQAAIDKASEQKDPKAAQAAMQQAYENERNAIRGVTDEIVKRYNETQKLQQLSTHGVNAAIGLVTTGAGAPDQTANLTELGKAGHLAQQELRNLDLTMSNMGKNSTLDRLRDKASEMRLSVKEAAAEWKKLEADFVKFQEDSLAAGHKPTAQEDLNWLKSREVSINPLNRDKLSAKELPFENKVAGNNWIEEQSQKLKDTVGTIGLYDDALKEASEMNRLLEAASRKQITVTDEQKSAWQDLIKTIVESREYDRQLETIYRSINDASDVYEASLKAINKLHADGVLTTAQFGQGLERIKRDHDEASDAVARYRRSLLEAQQVESSKLGTDQQVAVKSALEQLDSALRQSGVDAQHPFGYSEEEIQKINAQLAPLLAQLQQKNAIDQEANRLINEQANLTAQAQIHQSALNAALKAGAISQDAYNAARLKDQIAVNDHQLESGNIKSSKQPYVGAIMDYAKQFTSLAKSIKDTFSGVFKTLGDGFADTIGRWITQGGNLKEMLKQVAREGIGELISGLIKLGLQQVIMLTLGQAMASAATAAGVAQASILTAAWTPAAYAASVATMGSADAIGAASYTTGLGAVTALSKIPALATGTNQVPTDMLALIHQDERIIPAADNRDLMAALQGNQGGSGHAAHVEVHNYGSQQVAVEHVTPMHVRVMIREMVPDLVTQHAPAAVANDLANPNGKASKALQRNTYSERRR